MMKPVFHSFRAAMAFFLAVCLLAGAFFACAEDVPDLTEILQQYEQRKSRIEPVMEAIARKKDFPCIYLTTLNQMKIESRETYIPAVINVFNCPEEYRLTSAAGIRVRGNSTANDEEKPYRIKFEKKQNLLGLHDGMAFKSWVLLRSFWNLAADYMGFRLAEAIFDGQYYSSDCMYVNLYLNGWFKGIYVLCEQNQAAKGRVSVHEPKEGNTRTDVGYLVEMDNYASDEHPFFTLKQRLEVTDIAGETRVLPSRNYSIKSDVWCREQEEFIHQHIDQVYTILYEAAVNHKALILDENSWLVPAPGMTPLEALNRVMDLNSLANMLILEELVQNNDVGAGNFFMAVDFSNDTLYPRLTFLAPWDFNWGYSEDPEGGYYACTFQPLWTDGWERSNVWFVLAAKVDGFMDLVREKWKALDESGVIEQTAAQVLQDCEALEKDLENGSWKLQNGRNIVAFVQKRVCWLREKWR